MGIIIIVFIGWAISATVKACKLTAERRRAAQVIFERQRQRELQAARAASVREACRQQQLQIREEQRQYLAASREYIAQQQAARREMEQARKDAEKERKAAFEREQAEADLEHYEAMRRGYMRLYDTLEEELDAATTTPKRRVAIQRQLLTLEEKLYRIDQRRAKAYYLKGAC